jgi:hypothetical protein
MEETTTKTEQKRKMITLTEKQDNKNQSKLKNKKNTEEKPNNMLNNTLIDIEQNKNTRKQKTTLKFKNKQHYKARNKNQRNSEQREETEGKRGQEEINTLRMLNPYLNPSLNSSLPEGDILTFSNSNPNPTRNEVIKLDQTGKYVLKLPHASRNTDRIL